MRFLKEYWGLLSLALMAMCVVWMGRTQRAKFAQERRYTVAEVSSTGWMLKSGKNAYCSFYVNEKRYGTHANADHLAGQHLIGRRFLVKYHPPDPKYNVLYLEAPVSDTIQPPADGWTKPPFPVPAEVLE